jgi:hypothetical protein
MGLRNLWFTLIAVLWCGRFLPQAVGFGAPQQAGRAAATWAAASRRVESASRPTAGPATKSSPSVLRQRADSPAEAGRALTPATIADSPSARGRVMTPPAIADSPATAGRTLTPAAIAGPA